MSEASLGNIDVVTERRKEASGADPLEERRSGSQTETARAKNDPKKDKKVADVNRMGGERTSTMSSSRRGTRRTGEVKQIDDTKIAEEREGRGEEKEQEQGEHGKSGKGRTRRKHTTGATAAGAPTEQTQREG